MKEIKLNNRFKNHNLVALVDDDDYLYLNQYNWYAHKEHNNIYAVRNIRNGDKKRTVIRMHRLICHLHNEMEVDHINNNGLDNRKCNLRICTHRENMHNRNKQYNNTTGFKGVTFDKNRNKWQVQIRSGEIKYSKRFDNLIDAALYYNEKAIQLHKEFANINILHF